jgi:hypothetical protein
MPAYVCVMNDNSEFPMSVPVILVLGLGLKTNIFGRGLGLESQVLGLASSRLDLDVTGLINT